MKNLAIRERSRVKFRKVQTIVNLMNNSFNLYLSTSPSILLAILVLLLFSTIRYSGMDVTSFIMYPACALRCIFESFSLLAWAGHVNTESYNPMKNWERTRSKVQASKDFKYEVAFGKSCRPLSISAGSYYTFESTIVLTTIHICSENTFNLLVAYK